MTCAEFQKVLPYIIETGGNAEEEEHLRSCPVCTDLVTDLKYIAEQAKLLLPMHEPSPKVWEDIKGSLQREGLIDKPARARGGLLSPRGKKKKFGIAGGALTLVLLTAFFFYHPRKHGANEPSHIVVRAEGLTGTPNGADVAGLNPLDDRNLLDTVSATAPDLRAIFENDLRRVNAYISDAQNYSRSHPGDDEARVHLLSAYNEKALVYEMAISHSMR